MKKLLFTAAIVATALCSNAQFEATDILNTSGGTTMYHQLNYPSATEVHVKQFDNGNTKVPRFRFGRAGGTFASPSAVSASDRVGQIMFMGYHTSAWANVASIGVEMTPGYTPSSSSMPGNIYFQTTPYLSTTLATRMTITHGGKVGIGTETPGAQLTVNTSAIFNEGGGGDYDFRVESATAAYALYVNSETSGDEEVVINDDGVSTLDFRIEGSGQTDLFSTDAGNARIGIGTASPLTLLDVDGDAVFNKSYADKDFRVATKTATYAFFIDSKASGDEEVVINDNEVATVNFRVEGLDGTTDNEKLIWVDAGLNAVGILTGNLQDGATTYRLSVDGKVRCEELKVYDSGSWGDYVFEDDYDLADLDEVEEYIQENKHLPGIPSAMEIEENGIEVGALIKLQMVKIEELTLHLIKQEKEIEALKNQLNNR